MTPFLCLNFLLDALHVQPLFTRVSLSLNEVVLHLLM